MIPRSVYWPCMPPKKYVEAKYFFRSFFTVHQAVTHCSQGQLEGVADLLWGPLFENSQNAEETTRNVAAACLGKLATIAPSRYLPELHVRTLTLPQIRITDFFFVRLASATQTQTLGPLSSLLSAIRLPTFRDHTTNFSLLSSLTFYRLWWMRIL